MQRCLPMLELGVADMGVLVDARLPFLCDQLVAFRGERASLEKSSALHSVSFTVNHATNFLVLGDKEVDFTHLPCGSAEQM